MKQLTDNLCISLDTICRVSASSVNLSNSAKLLLPRRVSYGYEKVSAKYCAQINRKAATAKQRKGKRGSCGVVGGGKNKFLINKRPQNQQNQFGRRVSQTTNKNKLPR